MAVNRDPSNILAQFSGRIGNLIIKNYGDKVVLSAIPDMSKRKLSPKQKAANKLMRLANIYAKKMTADPVKKAALAKQLKLPKEKVFRALVKDFLVKKGESDKLIKLPA